MALTRAEEDLLKQLMQDEDGTYVESEARVLHSLVEKGLVRVRVTLTDMGFDYAVSLSRSGR